MAVSGNLQNADAVKLGTTHQHDTLNTVEIWGYLKSDAVETATSTTVTMNAAFWYDGYHNYIPWEVGVFKILEDGTVYDGGYSQGDCSITSAMWQNSAWKLQWTGEKTFTINKSKNRFGILPYFKIGCIDRYSNIGDSGSGDYDLYNKTYGLLCRNSVVQTGYGSYGMTYGGHTIHAFTLLGGSSNTYTLSYANCPKISNPLNPLFVANSSGTYVRASNVYVYDSSGAPRRAKSITVYGSDGKPNTIQC